jgi:hypothetical protein
VDAANTEMTSLHPQSRTQASDVTPVKSTQNGILFFACSDQKIQKMTHFGQIAPEALC